MNAGWPGKGPAPFSGRGQILGGEGCYYGGMPHIPVAPGNPTRPASSHQDVMTQTVNYVNFNRDDEQAVWPDDWEAYPIGPVLPEAPPPNPCTADTVATFASTGPALDGPPGHPPSGPDSARSLESQLFDTTTLANRRATSLPSPNDDANEPSLRHRHIRTPRRN